MAFLEILFISVLSLFLIYRNFPEKFRFNNGEYSGMNGRLEEISEGDELEFSEKSEIVYSCEELYYDDTDDDNEFCEIHRSRTNILKKYIFGITRNISKEILVNMYEKEQYVSDDWHIPFFILNVGSVMTKDNFTKYQTICNRKSDQLWKNMKLSYSNSQVPIELDNEIEKAYSNYKSLTPDMVGTDTLRSLKANFKKMLFLRILLQELKNKKRTCYSLGSKNHSMFMYVYKLGVICSETDERPFSNLGSRKFELICDLAEDFKYAESFTYFKEVGDEMVKLARDFHEKLSSFYDDMNYEQYKEVVRTDIIFNIARKDILSECYDFGFLKKFNELNHTTKELLSDTEHLEFLFVELSKKTSLILDNTWYLDKEKPCDWEIRVYYIKYLLQICYFIYERYFWFKLVSNELFIVEKILGCVDENELEATIESILKEINKFV